MHLRPGDVRGFHKGDEVKVTVFFFDEDGFRSGDTETIATV